MKRFILRTLKFLSALLVIAIVGMIVPRFTPHQSLYFSLIDKHKLLEQTNSPRIILVGGSNLTFGINSEVIQDDVGIPVINTAIHAGLGLKYIIEDIEPYIRANDIVVLAPEYNHFYGDVLWGTEPMVSSIIALPSNLRLLNLENWRSIINEIPKESLRNFGRFAFRFSEKLIGRNSPGIYLRDSFNKYGDVTAHYNSAREQFISDNIESQYNPETVKVISEFREYTVGKRARLLVTFPCLNETSFKLYPDKIHKIDMVLKENNFRILGTPERYTFNDSLFFNSKYHLLRTGVIQRSELLAEDLKTAIVSDK